MEPTLSDSGQIARPYAWFWWWYKLTSKDNHYYRTNSKPFWRIFTLYGLYAINPYTQFSICVPICKDHHGIISVNTNQNQIAKSNNLYWWTLQFLSCVLFKPLVLYRTILVNNYQNKWLQSSPSLDWLQSITKQQSRTIRWLHTLTYEEKRKKKFIDVSSDSNHCSSLQPK